VGRNNGGDLLIGCLFNRAGRSTTASVVEHDMEGSEFIKGRFDDGARRVRFGN
jgi:hypothetical protein